MFVSGVDVNAASRLICTLVTLGDSITDGHYSTINANHRYPDYLARRLAARTGSTLSVSNAGISGNELLNYRNMQLFGAPAEVRFSRDVAGQTNALAVVLLEGINDIGADSTSATTLIQAQQNIIGQARAAGLVIYGGTLTPFGGSNPNYGGD